jgi:hypothetical protein
MSKYTWLGLILIGGGLLLLGFQSLQSLMGTEIVWKEITLNELLKPQHVDWIKNLSWVYLRQGLIYTIEKPLYLLLLVVGGAIFVLSGLLGKIH